ncbi:MAG: HAD family phosphatase [Candidatus Anstonellaceae archaeon]
MLYKSCKLHIEEKTTDGQVRKRTVHFQATPFGRAKLLCEGRMPEGMEKKYMGTLLAAFLSDSDYHILKTPQGWRLLDSKGRIYQYEFAIELPDGSQGIPYKEKLFGGERLFLDLRNTGLSRMLDGAMVRVWVNDVSIDLGNSFKGEITQVYKAIKLYNFNGSVSCLYIPESDEQKSFALPIPDFPPQLGLQENFAKRKHGHPSFRLVLQAESWFSPSLSAMFVQEKELLALSQPVEPEFAMEQNELQGQMPKQESPFFHSTHPQSSPHQLEVHSILPIASFPQSQSFQQFHSYVPIPSARSTKSSKVQASKEKKERNAESKESASTNESQTFQPVPISSISNLRAAIFDLDGVIVDSEKAHLHTFNHVLSKMGIKISHAEWKRNYTGVGSVAILQDLFGKHKVRKDIFPILKERAEIYHDYVEKKGLKETPGFSKFFAYLSKNGIAAAIASGGHKPHILASMMSIGIPKIPFVGLEDVKNRKPAPDAFLLAAQKLGVRPSECIVFEDSLAGVQAAASAGMPCIALCTTLPRKELEGKAALVIRNFRSKKLMQVISKLIRKRKAVQGKPSSARR